MISKLALLSNSDNKLRNCNEVCLRTNSDTSIEEATNRVFVVGHKSILSYLKKLVLSFGLRWSFCTTRSGRVIKYNRDTCHG